MTGVLWTSLAVLAWTLARALRLLRRTGEARVGLVAGIAVPLGLVAAALLALQRGRPLGLDLETAAAIAILAASVAGLLVVRAFASTLEELELAEALHWGSMQGVRAVTQLAAEQRGELEERIQALLELGCERFGLEVGFLSRIEGEEQEIRALHAPAGFPLAVGAKLPLGSTLCRHTLAAERPVAVERVSAADWARSTEADPLGFEAYLGTSVTADGRRFGTLVFGSRSPHAQRFTASHKDLLALMAQWAGVEIERREALRAVPAPLPEPVAPMDAPARSRLRRSGVDLNAVLRRVEQRIRDLAPPRVRLVVHASAEPALARYVGVPPESLLLTLVAHALEAMQGVGTLTLASERSSADPARWVTLSVSYTGRGSHASALARALAPGGDAKRDAFALAGLVRALRRGGGDLSISVDPASGSTITLFLPAATRQPRVASAARGAVAAPPPPPPGN